MPPDDGVPPEERLEKVRSLLRLIRSEHGSLSGRSSGLQSGAGLAETIVVMGSVNIHAIHVHQVAGDPVRAEKLISDSFKQSADG